MRRKIVTLCGSTRFFDAFMKANYDETMKGNIVLSIGFYPGATDGVHMEGVGCDEQQKLELDLLYFDKIELSDEILVLNINNYVGESTYREIGWALHLGKAVRFLEASSEVAAWLSKNRRAMIEGAQGFLQDQQFRIAAGRVD